MHLNRLGNDCLKAESLAVGRHQQFVRQHLCAHPYRPSALVIGPLVNLMAGFVNQGNAVILVLVYINLLAQRPGGISGKVVFPVALHQAGARPAEVGGIKIGIAERVDIFRQVVERTGEKGKGAVSGPKPVHIAREGIIASIRSRFPVIKIKSAARASRSGGKRLVTAQCAVGIGFL